MAIKVDSSHTIETLLLDGLNVNYCFDGQHTLLHEAAMHNACNVAKVILLEFY